MIYVYDMSAIEDIFNDSELTVSEFLEKFDDFISDGNFFECDAVKPAIFVESTMSGLKFAVGSKSLNTSGLPNTEKLREMLIEEDDDTRKISIENLLSEYPVFDYETDTLGVIDYGFTSDIDIRDELSDMYEEDYITFDDICDMIDYSSYKEEKCYIGLTDDDIYLLSIQAYIKERF